jgi:mannose-1-phosphate guanylyltransferase
VIGPGAVVDDGCVATDAVVGDGAHVGARNELLAGARVWTGVTLPDCAVRFSSDV